jgi:hypothetical protein
VIGHLHVATDGVLEFARAAVHTTPELLLGQRGKPAFLPD